MAAIVRALRRRRRVVLVVAVVLVIAVRVALPAILRAVIVSQANAALAGVVTVADVDLWLVLGGVALEDVALRAEGAGPADAPLVAFRRLYVQVGYLPLLRRTLRIEDFGLDGLALRVDRVKSGALVLPTLRPPAAGAPPPAAPAPASAPSKPWNVVVDKAALSDGRLTFRDHVVEPPEQRELALDALALTGFTLRSGDENAPGHGSIEAKFGDGTLRLETTLLTRPEGYALDARIDAANLPLDRAQVHLPELGWSEFAGRMDAAIALHAEPGALPTAGGTVAIRDLRVDVPDESAPALAWRRLDVDVERIDPIARRAAVKRVALDGGAVVVTPRAATPLPLLAGRAQRAPAPEPAPPAAEPETPAKPWTWTVGAVEVTDTRATVVLEPPPLEIQIVKAALTDLASEPGSRAGVVLELRQGEGTIAVDGTVTLDPLGWKLHTRVDRLALGPLVAASGAAPVRLPGGTLGADVTLEAAPAPLVVSGQVSLADLAVAQPEGEDFALGWKRLEIGAREIRVPGILPADRGASGQPMRIDLERLQLVAPTALLTRAPEGLVLPGAGAPPAEEGVSPAAAEPSAGPGPSVTLGRLELEGGQVAIVDRTVKPFYRGKVSAIGLTARGLRVPENAFDEFSFNARLPGSAPLTVTGRRTKGGVQVDVGAQRIPLAQFNAYVTQAAGYSIGRGAATFAARVRWAADAYESQNRIELDQLTVAGVAGDSLFLQRFGVPLTLAIGLMRDVHGKIALDVPIRGDQRGARIDVGAVVAEALAHAIVNAITSPLKLLGALSLDGDKVAGFAPEPIEFPAGRPVPEAAGKERVEQLARVLAGAPGLGVELRGGAGPADVRALQEAAVLADLQGERRVVGGLRNLASGGDRSAIRDALVARAAGGAGELTPGRQATLEEWVAKKAITDDALRALAVTRAEGLKALIAKDYGIDPGRVALGEAQVDRAEGKPAVGVAIAAGS